MKNNVELVLINRVPIWVLWWFYYDPFNNKRLDIHLYKKEYSIKHVDKLCCDRIYSMNDVDKLTK